MAAILPAVVPGGGGDDGGADERRSGTRAGKVACLGGGWEVYFIIYSVDRI